MNKKQNSCGPEPGIISRPQTFPKSVESNGLLLCSSKDFSNDLEVIARVDMLWEDSVCLQCVGCTVTRTQGSAKYQGMFQMEVQDL